MGMNMQTKLRNFHQARWDEPIIFELSTPGERGMLLPPVEEAVARTGAPGLEKIPSFMKRSTPPALPEMGQMRVLKHYLRLSRKTLGRTSMWISVRERAP